MKWTSFVTIKQQCCRICTLTLADGLELTEVIPNVGDDNNISDTRYQVHVLSTVGVRSTM